MLDGELYFDSRVDGPKQFIVEESPAERGLHEAVQLLAKGDSARIILPPHLAYGLAGDGEKIPGRAILWCEIRIDSVNTGLRN
jgi:FKBP-type peptidyl-prolyl cis-trans isomerase